MSDLETIALDTDGKPYKDEDLLRELYVERGLSQVEIADLFGCADCTVSEYRRKYGIERKYSRPEWLREQYHEEGLSLTEIAENCGVDVRTIHRRMQEHGIERRSISESRTDGDIAKLHDGEWLRTEYVEKERTTVDIAGELNVTNWVVGKWLERHGIEARPTPCLPGEDNLLWTGGYENYYGANWERQREKALERDGYECTVCGMGNDGHRERYNRGLDVHHIKPIRTFDTPEDANTLDNLVVLCDACHKRWEGIPLRPEMIT